MNMWQRLGVVLSALFLVIGGFLLENDAQSRARMAASATKDACHPIHGEAPELFEGRCTHSAYLAAERELSEDRKNFVLQMIVCLAAVWGLAYAAVYSTRWVRAGRKT
ncbi:hypothetical protein [Sphingomonas aerolata]|jgi:hypothetical protein|uniref:hypothetical protein n=1 Tax=Sphingomonas aerolata TaxID=185951 RepID=UPI00208E757B|nr:hypothetical protein [Sphingomonas aerolata]USQ99556.1 hypothetical protein NEF64_14185 [Sphingomonas aerolata]